MQIDKLQHRLGSDTTTALEIHEITYWKHYTGANETEVRAAIIRAGNNRGKIERYLKREAPRDY